VTFHFFSVGRAGEAMPIAVMIAVKPGTLKTEGKPREDTARPRKGKSSIGKQKTVADTVKLSANQKRWMIHLQQCCRSGVRQQ